VTDLPVFDQWCIAELLGHRRLAGRIREVQLAGAGFLRLDIPATGGHDAQTQYIAPGSVYALHPTTEEIATAVAAQCRPAPVHRWELPAPPAGDDPDGPEEDDEDEDEDEDQAAAGAGTWLH
jgi:hypothetical protein